jgi:archaellum component FlaC
VSFRTKFLSKPKRDNEKKADDSIYKLFALRTDIYNAFINLILDNYDVNFDPIEHMPTSIKEILKSVHDVSRDFITFLSDHLEFDGSSICQPNEIIKAYYATEEIPHKSTLEYKRKIQVIENFILNYALDQ